MSRANENAGKGGHCRENWVVEAGGPMSNQRNGFRAVLKKIFVKLRWKSGAVSMVLFSKGKKWHS